MPLDQEHAREEIDASVMSFGDHLEELRARFIKALIVPLPLAVVLFFFASSIRELLIRPVRSALLDSGLPPQLQAMSPVETLATDIKLSLVFAIVLSAPWIIYQLWKFIEPGLFSHERRFVHFLVPMSAVLTASGLALLYFVMLPLMLRVLIAFGTAPPAQVISTNAQGVVIDDGLAGALSGLGEPVEQAAVEEPSDGTSSNDGGSGAPDPGDGASDRSSNAAPGDAELPIAGPSLPILDAIPDRLRDGTAWIDSRTNSLCIVLPLEVESDGTTRYEIRRIGLVRDGTIVQQYRLKEYVGFVLLLMAGIAIAFQMPLVILLLGWLDIVPREFLARNRRYAVFICAIVGAIVTPAEAVSMVLMWIPLYGLYELGLLLLRFAPARRVSSGTVFSGAVRDAWHTVRGRPVSDAPTRSDRSAEAPRSNTDVREPEARDRREPTDGPTNAPEDDRDADGSNPPPGDGPDTPRSPGSSDSGERERPDAGE